MSMPMRVTVVDDPYPDLRVDSMQGGTVTTPARYEPGAIYDAAYASRGEHTCMYWDNCDGHHIHVVSQNHHTFDLMSRASNCGLPNDRSHRCWVVHIPDGDLSRTTVDKNGLTCSAGAGSLLAQPINRTDGTTIPGWHGFLRNGVLDEC